MRACVTQAPRGTRRVHRTPRPANGDLDRRLSSLRHPAHRPEKQLAGSQAMCKQVHACMCSHCRRADASAALTQSTGAPYSRAKASRHRQEANLPAPARIRHAHREMPQIPTSMHAACSPAGNLEPRVVQMVDSDRRNVGIPQSSRPCGPCPMSQCTVTKHTRCAARVARRFFSFALARAHARAQSVSACAPRAPRAGAG